MNGGTAVGMAGMINGGGVAVFGLGLVSAPDELRAAHSNITVTGRVRVPRHHRVVAHDRERHDKSACPPKPLLPQRVQTIQIPFPSLTQSGIYRLVRLRVARPMPTAPIRVTGSSQSCPRRVGSSVVPLETASTCTAFSAVPCASTCLNRGRAYLRRVGNPGILNAALIC